MATLGNPYLAPFITLGTVKSAMEKV